MPVTVTRLMRAALMLMGCLLFWTSTILHAEDDWTQAYAESADGTRIAYYVAGAAKPNKTPLILVSGGPGSDHRYMRVGGSFDAL